MFLGFCHSSRPQNGNKRKQKDKQILGPYQRTMKAEEHEGYSETNFSWHSCNSHQRLEKGSKRIGNHRKNQDHSEYSIVEINQNIQKSPGDMRRFIVTQALVNDHQLMQVWKTHKQWNNNSYNNICKISKILCIRTSSKFREYSELDMYLCSLHYKEWISLSFFSCSLPLSVERKPLTFSADYTSKEGDRIDQPKCYGKNMSFIVKTTVGMMLIL